MFHLHGNGSSTRRGLVATALVAAIASSFLIFSTGAAGAASVGVIPSPEGGGWKLNGTSVVQAGALQLTNATTPAQAGSVFWPTAVDASSLDVTFSESIDSGSGADGLTFTIADSSRIGSTALGRNGDGLGTAGIPGLAVAIGTFASATTPSANFIGLSKGLTSAGKLAWAASASPAASFRNSVHAIHLVISAGTLTASVDGTAMFSTAVTVPASSYLGFTASDGSLTDRHAISNVVINNAVPIAPVAPGTATNVVPVAGNGAATVSWAAPSYSGSAPVTSYQVTAQPGAKVVTVTGTPLPTTATVPGLINGTAYTISVVPVSAAGAGRAAVAQPVTPLDAPGRVPAKFEPPNGQTYLGVSSSISSVSAFDSVVGISSHPAIFNAYTPEFGTLQPVLDEADQFPGTTPMISWDIPMNNNVILNGSEDSYLAGQAAVAAAYGKPIFLRLDWEMNGTWYPDYSVSGGVTPAEYIAAWDHIHAFFAAAPNVAFVWSPNTGSPNPGNVTPFTWYPGDNEVDWIALDSYPDYVTNPTYAVKGPDGLNDFANDAAAHGKPLMLAEWARGNSTNPPDTAATINLVYDWAESFPNTVKALVYFDYAGNQYHDLETHPVAAAAFKARTAGNPKYLVNVVGSGQ